jgi:hypothetical protein
MSDYIDSAEERLLKAEGFIQAALRMSIGVVDSHVTLAIKATQQLVTLAREDLKDQRYLQLQENERDE